MSPTTTPLPVAALALALFSLGPAEAEAGTLSAPLPRRVAPKAKRKVARCLPVVAPKCGCVYSCGVGWPVGKKSESRYRVRHSFWGKSVLKAKVHNWCVSKRCTLAFHAEIVCAGICPRRPANATCGFVRRGKVELCTSGGKTKGKGPARKRP